MQFFGGLSAAPPGTATGLAGNNANMLYMFERSGVYLLYRRWHHPLHTLDTQQDQKLMFGLLFSLSSFIAKMDPPAFIKERLGCLCSPDKVAPSTASARTNTYKLSFMECPSGIKAALATNIQGVLQTITANTLEFMNCFVLSKTIRPHYGVDDGGTIFHIEAILLGD